MLRAIQKRLLNLVLVVSGASFACSAAPAYADGEHLQMQTGNDALTTCTANFETEIMAASICLAWMQGVRDGHFMTMALSGFDQPLWCTPDNVTNQQLRDIFVKYLRENPERRHEMPAFLYLRAMRGAFPCPTAAIRE